MCINCLLCYAACPIYALEPGFVGPAAIALAQRYNLDSRDQGAAERMEILSHHEGIWGCTFVGECSVVCPKHVDPAGAIQRYKVRATAEWWKSLVLPWGGGERPTTRHICTTRVGTAGGCRSSGGWPSAPTSSSSPAS